MNVPQTMAVAQKAVKIHLGASTAPVQRGILYRVMMSHAQVCKGHAPQRK